MAYSLPGSSVHGTLQARILESLPFPSPGDLPDQRIKPGSPAAAADAAAKSLQSRPTLCDPMDCSLPGLLRPWDSPGKNTGVGCHFLLPPALQADSLPTELQGKIQPS